MLVEIAASIFGFAVSVAALAVALHERPGRTQRIALWVTLAASIVAGGAEIIEVWLAHETLAVLEGRIIQVIGDRQMTSEEIATGVQSSLPVGNNLTEGNVATAIADLVAKKKLIVAPGQWLTANGIAHVTRMYHR
jgi:hypothetical protein